MYEYKRGAYTYYKYILYYSYIILQQIKFLTKDSRKTEENSS